MFDAIALAYAESGRGADGGGKERPPVRRPRPDIRTLGLDVDGVRLLADAARDFLNPRAQARETERTAARASRRGPRRGRPREDGFRWRVAEGMDLFRAFRGDSGKLGWNDIEERYQGSLFAFLAPYVRLVYPDAGDEAIAKLAMKTRKRARAARNSPA
ncbi:MAG: hypothetical protein K8I02_00215 [Candidatus Methylomirabilis sp.]|nr:hypothetical protein [Deltaproteobacteria bacterium]